MSLAMTFCPAPQRSRHYRCMRTDAAAARSIGQRGSSVGFTDAGASLKFFREQNHGPLPEMRRPSHSYATRWPEEMSSLWISPSGRASRPQRPIVRAVG